MRAGCFLVGDLLFEPEALSDWLPFLLEKGVCAGVFRPEEGDLHLSLQRAYQRVRQEDGISTILAAGSGCDCALALAGQLPVDRMALIHPLDWQGRGGMAGRLNAIRRYARRAASFCVADTLILPGLHTSTELMKRWQGALYNSRVGMLKTSEDMWTNRKEVLKLAVYRFLMEGLPPKSLAENSEMCIIYG